jgi:hypothetical protein
MREQNVIRIKTGRPVTTIRDDMNANTKPAKPAKEGFGLLDKERIVAGPGFNRCLVPPDAQANSSQTQQPVHVSKVWGVPQFWLLWMVLCMNVSAGIGVIGMASPMLQ